jgi:hypothetical protein
MTTDVKKRVCARRQALRLKIENYKITRDALPVMEFTGKKRINRDIERAESELNMLETQWRF